MLTARRFTLPLQALEPMDLDGDGVATLLLLNPTGGVLGGDRLETDVELGAGSRVCLSTPSATRVYRSAGARRRPARSTMRRRTQARRSSSARSPDPVAGRAPPADDRDPAGRRTPRCSTSTPGRRDARRAARRWGFDLLDSSLLVRDEAGLLLRERSILAGHPRRDGLGGTEGFAYAATFVAIRAAGGGWEELATALQAELDASGAAGRAGVTTLGRGGVLARLLCPSAPALQAAVQALWAACRQRLLGLPPARLRKL